MGQAMRGQGAGLDPSRISHVGPSIDRGITVQQFTIVPFEWHADSIAIAGNGSEVAQTQYLILLILCLSQKGDHGMGRIAKVYPLKAGPVVIEFVHRPLLAVEPVEVSYEPLDPHVSFVIT